MKTCVLLLVLGLALAAYGMAFDENFPARDGIKPKAGPLVVSVDLGESFKEISAIMASVDNLPSCSKVASSALLHSCSQLGHSDAISVDKGLDTMLDNTKSIYATRLAICELIEAKAPIPISCSTFRPTHDNAKGGFFKGLFSVHRTSNPVPYYDVYDKETSEQLEECKSSLYQKSQMWTSYSNARQNAVIMCHAMRAEIERDDAIEFFKLMSEASEEAKAKMTSASEDFDNFLKNFRSVRANMQTFQTNLTAGHEKNAAIVNKHWDDLATAASLAAANIEHMQEISLNLSEELGAYRSEAGLAHERSVEAIEETHGRLVDTGAVAADIESHMIATARIGKQMSEDVAIMYNITIASITAAQQLLTNIGMLQSSLNTMSGALQDLSSNMGSISSVVGAISLIFSIRGALALCVGILVVGILFDSRGLKVIGISLTTFVLGSMAYDMALKSQSVVGSLGDLQATMKYCGILMIGGLLVVGSFLTIPSPKARQGFHAWSPL